MKISKNGFYKTLCLDSGARGFKIFAKIVQASGVLCVLIYRASSYLYNKGPVGWFLSNILFRLNTFLFGCEISPAAKIGVCFHIAHPIGVVIGPIRAGRNLKIYKGITIGEKRDRDDKPGYADIGNNVTIYPNAVIAGALKIGNNAIIGPNVVVTTNIPENTITKVPDSIMKPLTGPKA